jgi:peptidoglycan/xylan/chitin deacetylase (PgdA/CDA1 family)
MKTGALQVRNVMTIDVEDYFQVSAFAPYIARAEWAEYECRVERNVSIILQLLADRQIKATFFTLG